MHYKKLPPDTDWYEEGALAPRAERPLLLAQASNASEQTPSTGPSMGGCYPYVCALAVILSDGRACGLVISNG